MLELAGRFFRTPLRRSDVVWRYSGVRPLYDDASADPSAVTRDYHLSLDATEGVPRLSVYGGKVTTYRRLAEEALALLAPHFDRVAGAAWTANAPLPGGDIAAADFDGYLAELQRRLPAFEPHWLRRIARRHGTLVDVVMGDAKTSADMGRDLFGGLTEREIIYMKANEWAKHPDDVLWRRSKFGLHALTALDADQRQSLSDKISSLL